jgi:hypothetical protein
MDYFVELGFIQEFKKLCYCLNHCGMDARDK